MAVPLVLHEACGNVGGRRVCAFSRGNGVGEWLRDWGLYMECAVPLMAAPSWHMSGFATVPEGGEGWGVRSSGKGTIYELCHSFDDDSHNLFLHILFCVP